MPSAIDPAGREQAVRENRAIIEQTVGADDAPSVKKRAIAFWRLGSNLRQLNRFDEAVDSLDEAQRMLAGIPSVHFVAVQAGVSRAFCLLELDRVQEALVSADRSLELARAMPELPLPEVVPMALRLRLKSLERLGLDDEADRAAEAAIEEFGSTETEMAQFTVVGALALQGRLAQSRGDYVRAVSKFNKAVARLTRKEIVLADALQAIVGRAAVYELVGERSRARRGYETVLGWTEGYSDAELDREALQAVADATAGKQRLARRRWSLPSR